MAACLQREALPLKRILILALLSIVAVAAAGCASTEERRGEFLTGYARALAWAPDSRQIVAIREFDLVVLDAATLKPLVTHKAAQQEFKTFFPTASIAFSPDGKTFATAGFDGGVLLWDALTWLSKGRLKDGERGTAVAFTPDGSMLIVAGPDAALMVFDVASMTPVSTIVAAPSGIMSVAISRDGKLLATGEMNQQLRLWKLAGNELSTTVAGYSGPVLSVDYSPDGRLLASMAGGREARLLHLDDLTTTVTLIDPAKPTPQQGSAESLVALLSIVGMARSMQLTGAPGGAPVMGFSYPQWPSFNCPLAFSPDGKFLALARISHELSSSNHIEVYDVASGTRVSRYSPGLSSLAFSPDGKRLAVSGVYRIVLLDPLTGREIPVGK